MNIAVIPARGGSKRILKKNIKEFHGMPIIGYPIAACLNSKSIDKVYVSTDDEEIAAVSQGFGAEVPFLRASHLADDYTPLVPVIKDFLKEIKGNTSEAIGTCTCILPTTPFLTTNDLDAAVQDIKTRDEIDFIFSATEYTYPIQRALKVGKGGSVEMFYPRYRDTRSQDLEKSFHDAGQFYCGSLNAWEAHDNIFETKTKIITIPSFRSVDIDTNEDWMRAEHLFQALSI